VVIVKKGAELKILLVEDNEMNRDMLSQRLNCKEELLLSLNNPCGRNIAFHAEASYLSLDKRALNKVYVLFPSYGHRPF